MDKVAILSSNSAVFKVGDVCGLDQYGKGPVTKFYVMKSMFSSIEVDFKKITVELLNKENSKPYLVATGVSLTGAVLLGPLGLLAGAFVPDEVNALYGFTFFHDNKEVKLVVNVKSKSLIDGIKISMFEKT